MSSTQPHSDGRNEETNAGEQSQRRANVTTDPSTSNNPLVEAIQRNIQSLGGVIPSVDWGSIGVPGRNDDFASNGIERPLAARTSIAESLIRRAARGGYTGHASQVCQPGITAQPTANQPFAVARNEVDQVNQQSQPVPSIADSLPPPALPYVIELVTVAPGVQIQKKKFLPRSMPGPIEKSPKKGRAIRGRGALLYNMTPRPDYPSESFAQGNRNDAALAGTSGNMDPSNPIPGPSHNNPPGIPGWPAQYNHTRDTAPAGSAAASGDVGNPVVGPPGFPRHAPYNHTRDANPSTNNDRSNSAAGPSNGNPHFRWNPFQE